MQSIVCSSVSLMFDFLWHYICACHLLVVRRHSFISFKWLVWYQYIIVSLCFYSLIFKEVVCQKSHSVFLITTACVAAGHLIAHTRC
jgi:hypothetical protein